MHRLLKRQLKKVGAKSVEELNLEQTQELVRFINQAYYDADRDRELVENSLEVSSMEMQKLYEELKLKSEKKIATSEAKYERLVHNLKHYYFFYSHGKDGVYNYVSDSMTQMLGFETDEFLTHYSHHLTSDPSNKKIQAYKEQALNGASQAPYVINIKHKNGSTRFIEVMEVPVVNSDNIVIELEGIARDITDQVNIREQLNYLAEHDPLTGIPNRYSLVHQIDNMIKEANRNDTQFAVLFIDLDHFKNINDSLGHEIGDKLLMSIVDDIKPTIRGKDVFARLGGDEFIIVLNDINSLSLVKFIERIMVLLRQERTIDDFEIVISSSIGVALYPEDGDDSQSLMKNADIAMYKAKNTGRDTFSLFTDEINQQVQKEISLEKEMAKALEEGQFVLFYQPKLRVSDDRIIGAEALIRWQHPERGLVGPYEFIHLAENTGFIIKLGRWIIEESCRAAVRFNLQCPTKLHVAINISSRQIQNDDIYDVLEKAISATGVDPAQIQIELTESIMMKHTHNAAAALKKIKQLGVHIALDDFGTGYSSLSYLQSFPIDSLKIDKSFVDKIENTRTNAVLLDTILAMAKTLNLNAVAEGIETAEQLEYLRSHNCPHYQGYLFSEPLVEAQFLHLLQQHTAAKLT